MVNDNNYVTGSSQDAEQWINNSNLPNIVKSSLLRFSRRFPSCEFYKEGIRVSNPFETEQIALPKWLRDIRQVLCFVAPENFIAAHIDMPEENGGGWYTFYMGQYQIDSSFIDRLNNLPQSGLSLLPIGESVSDPGTILAVEYLNTTDRKVYTLNMDSIWDFRHNKLPIEDAVYVLVDSYEEIFEHISTIQIGFGEEAEIIVAHE